MRRLRYSVGTLYCQYALKSEFYQNKVSRLKKAIVVLKKGLKLDPENYKLLTVIGRVYLTLGYPSKAEAYLVKSLGHEKMQPIAIALLSICLTVNGHVKEGYKVVDKGIKETKHLPEATVLLSMTRALLTFQYEKEKKAFNSHYEKYKLVSSIGNGGKSFV